MGRIILYAVLYAILLVQFLGGAIAFYRIDPAVLFNSISLKNGVFLGLFVLIHLLGLAGAILAAFRLRVGFLMSIVHHLLMVIGVKIGTAFTFFTHDVVSFYLFVTSSFGEISWTYRWSVGLDSIFAQVAPNTRVTYIGANVFALACAGFLWWVMKQTRAEEVEEYYEEPVRPRQRPQRPMPADGRQQRRAG